MTPITNFDIFLLIEIFVKLTLVTYFIRYLITFVLPQEFRNFFDSYVRAVRNQSVEYSDKYFPNTSNFEVVILSRIIIPLLFMLTLNTYLDFLLVTYVFGKYLFMGYFFYILRLYFFLNIAPNLDDLELLYDSTGTSKIIFFFKILIIFMIYTSLTPFTVSIIIVIPISDFFNLNNYQLGDIIDNHPSWDFQ